jgi:putative tryptophan/tyrosine transport system substrate-binding protein
VTSATRSDVLPDTPILTDYVPGVEASFWTGVAAPKNTPVEIIEMLNKEINAGLADPKLKARFADLGATPIPGSPSDFGQFIAEETEKWSKAVKFAGVRADQQVERVRRICVLVFAAENDFMQRDATLAFREELRKLGWIEGGNLQIDLRFGAGDSSRTRTYAGELVSLGPDVIVTTLQLATTAAQQQTQTIPIILAGVGDPSADGTVRNIARPEGNTTGFTNLNASFGGKWIELLREVAPGVARVELVSDAGALSSAYIPYIDAAARSVGVNTIPLPISNAAEIEPALRAFALEPKGALIVLPDASSIAARELIRLAADYRLPAIYADKRIVVEGGLMSYGTDIIKVWRQVTSYVDRIRDGSRGRRIS